MKWVILWLLAGTGIFLAFQYGLHQRTQPKAYLQDGTVVLPKGADGHYHWQGRVNGRPVEFLVDTGATRTSISQDLAAKAGLTLGEGVPVQTAAGEATARQATAHIELEGLGRFENMKVLVMPTDDGTALLGMNVLGQLDIVQQDGELRLRKRPD